MKLKPKLGWTWRSSLTAAALAASAPLLAAPAAQAQEKIKVYVAAGFDGNTWMDACLNLLRAIAQTAAYKDKVELEIQSARGDAQTQQQQINAMVQAGADVILVWAMSTTVLNRAVENACRQGVTVVAWDAEMTAPCSYYVGIDQTLGGTGTAEWLAEEMGGEGDIIFMQGIPGTMASDMRDEGAREVFAGHPDMQIVAEAASMYNPATARQKFSEIIAARGWDAVDGVFTQTGCYEFAKLQTEAGRDELLPCAGNGTNGFRVSMLSEGTTEGAIGNRGASMGSPPWVAPYAFKLALRIHEGEEMERRIITPMPLVTPENNVFCEKGDLEELTAKDWACTALPLSVAPSNYFIDVWSKEVPELDFYSALNATVPAGQ